MFTQRKFDFEFEFFFIFRISFFDLFILSINSFRFSTMTTRFFGNSKYQWKHTAQAVYEDRQSEYYNEESQGRKQRAI